MTARPPTPPLADRTAVITGATRGLGREIAERFAAAGASLLLVARDPVALKSLASDLAGRGLLTGQTIGSVCGDVAEPQTATAAAAAVADDAAVVLVNNAGRLGPVDRVEDGAWEDWIRTIEVNLFGTVSFCRAFLPRMRRQCRGKIINVSGGGATAPMPRASGYAASKAAVVRFTETLAREVADCRIDVNAIAPGAMNTGFVDAVLDAGPERAGADWHEQVRRQRGGAGVSPARAADLALFLASAASDGISGRLISAIWDDWAAISRHRDALATGDIYTLRRIVPEDRGAAW